MIYFTGTNRSVALPWRCVAPKEHISNRDVVRGIDERKQALEEEQRNLFLAAKQKMGKLRKEKEAELFR